jgi:hypothetical protein
MLRKWYIFTIVACVAGQASSPRWIKSTRARKITIPALTLLLSRADHWALHDALHDRHCRTIDGRNDSRRGAKRSTTPPIRLCIVLQPRVSVRPPPPARSLWESERAATGLLIHDLLHHCLFFVLIRFYYTTSFLVFVWRRQHWLPCLMNLHGTSWWVGAPWASREQILLNYFYLAIHISEFRGMAKTMAHGASHVVVLWQLIEGGSQQALCSDDLCRLRR